MTNFARALRIAMKYRWTVAGLMFSSLAVALFWGANLGTVYPIISVVLKQRSLHDWIDERIDQSRTLERQYTGQLAKLEDDLQSDPAERRRKISLVTSELNTEQRTLRHSLMMQPWIKRYLPRKPFPTLAVVVAALMLGTCLKTFFLVTSVVLVERLTQLTAFDLRKSLYRITLGMDLSHFGEQRTSTLLSHFTHDLDGVTNGIRTVFGRAIREPLKIVVCFAGAAFVCWRLLLFCLVVTPATLYLINRLAKSIKRANRRAMDDMAGVYGHLSESFNGIHVVKAFTREPFERLRMHQLSKEYLRKSMKIAVYTSLTKPCTEIMGIAVVCSAVLTGGYLVLSGNTHLFGFLRMSHRPLTFELLMTFFFLLAGVSDPFRKLVEVYNQVQRGMAAADRIYTLIDQPTKPKPASKTVAVTPLKTLTWEHVDFHYAPDVPVLRQINLELKAGQRIAIVGPNGCGKSTLIKMLPRFYQPCGGRILWNGNDIRDFSARELRSRIGIVGQQAFLFDDTVMNNIGYGRAHATPAEIIAAAKKAHAHRFIVSALENGYDTIVGPGGKLLSGGQRQRISLARSILRDPELLILDEATSQIDVESERLIHQALVEFTAGRTTVMVTHRVSSLELADQVIVMDAGKVVDFGSHHDLIQRCQLYQRIQHRQLRDSA